MKTALYVREAIELSDATEQRLLAFARARGLTSGDTLVVAAHRITAAPGYRLDVRDPADRQYQLDISLLAGVLDAPGLVVDVSGEAAASPGAPATAGRSARVLVRDLRTSLTVRADGGAGADGSAGLPGADETFTIEFDPRGHPRYDFEPPTTGGSGGDGAAGGNGGLATALVAAGPDPLVSASGGTGGAGGPGGPGGRGAVLPGGGRPRQDAPDGKPGQPGPNGLGGTAVVTRASSSAFWSAARAELGADLQEAARHWLAAARYRHRQVAGVPAPATTDLVVGLLDDAAGADPTATEPALVRAQFLSGHDALGLPRDLDVLPDFERYQTRLDTYGPRVDRLFDEVQDLLAATGASEVDGRRLAAQLATLEFTASILEVAHADAVKSLAVATAAEAAAIARWRAAVDVVNRRRTELERPVDWGGVVVIAMFSLAGLIIRAYGGETAGRIVASIPDLMTFGNLTFTGSEAETSILKQAVSAGERLQTSGARDAAGHQDSTGEVDVAAWVRATGPVVFSFAKFVADLDAATGDAELKGVVKDLAARLQEKLAATAARDAARRQVELAALRIEGARRDQAAYADLHRRASGDAGLLRMTALALLDVVRRYGDVFLDYQVRAARAVEIYTLRDQSDAKRLDRWWVHPDLELDYLAGLVDTTAFRSAVLLSAAELAVDRLALAFDDYDASGFVEDVHYVVLTDAVHLAHLRQQRSTTFTVATTDLAGARFDATVTAAVVRLDGVTAASPTFAVDLVHGGRCTLRRPDGTEVTELLHPRDAVLQVTPANGSATGAIAQSPQTRPVGFWRRSVATDWTVSIEGDVVADRAVDLSGLTGIRIALEYQAKRG